jgi:hypothetical protein
VPRPEALKKIAQMRERILYWTFTGLLAAWLLAGGTFDITHAKGAVAILAGLGYPEYLSTILGAAKLLAVLALMHPRTQRLREWAYAGITFDGMGALFSHIAMKDPAVPTLAPLVFLAITLGSYLLRPARYKTGPGPEPGSVSSH